MKAQCDRCKEIVALVFRGETGGIRVTCPSCAAEYFVPEPAQPAPAPAPEPRVPEVVAPPPDTVCCPKCGEPQKPSPACRRCGLAADKWSSWERTDGGTLPVDDGGATALFAACEARWDDRLRHDLFIAKCAAAGAWGYAAASYRRQTAVPGRREVAEARLAELRVKAEKALAVMPRKTDVKEPRDPMKTLLILAVVAVLLVAAIFVITDRMGGGHGTIRPAARSSP